MALSNLEKLASYQRKPSFELPVEAVRPWPKPLLLEALYGLSGEIVRAIEPHTESDPVAILAQLLTAFGVCIGKSCFKAVEADRHFTNLFIVLTGESSKGRKGTSFGYVRRLFEQADPEWVKNRIASGISSGEGLIWAVRDAVEKQQAKEDAPNGFETVMVDPGIKDKRLLVVEGEFASLLKQLEREGNTASPVIRNAWDSGNIASLTKNSPAKSTGAHIGLIGHITKTELLRYLRQTETANGFGNRFMWFCVKRSKRLPFGGNIDPARFEALGHTLSEAISFGKQAHELRFDSEASDAWIEIYEALAEEKPGLLGAMTARAEPQILRLSSIYALLDHSAIIRAPHLFAAIAMWQYAEESCRYIFGESTGDEIADRILEALRSAPGGLTLTEISESLFQRNKPSGEIRRALELLQAYNLAQTTKDSSGPGRPVQRWFATRYEHEINEENELSEGLSSDNSLNSYNAYSSESEVHP